jgi:quercetin dioxygenase-like cupin family protein
MRIPEFPEFVRNLPQAEIPLEDVDAWILQGNENQVLLIEVAVEQHLPVHTHGDQWGIVIDGEMDLTIEGVTETYHRGDSYFIPAGAAHNAVLREGFRALDIFADRDRYRIRRDSR